MQLLLTMYATIMTLISLKSFIDKWLFLVVFALIFLCCQEEKVYCDNTFHEIRIINKSPSCFQGFDYAKPESIEFKNEICEQLNKLVLPLEDVWVNSNRGIIDVYQDKKVLLVVVFSSYNGTIIRYNGDYYKNDVLSRKILKTLNLKMRADADEDCQKFNFE